MGHAHNPKSQMDMNGWISNYIHYEMWDEITYPFPNFNNGAIEV